MNEQQQILAEKVLKMRRAFARTESYSELRTKLEFALTYRRVALAAGVPMSPSAGNKATSFAVIGNSGSGKSTLIDRVLRTTPGLTLAEHGQPTCDVISLIVPSPATLKSLGRAILTSLGYPLQRERTSDAIWELVRAHLRERRVLFLHLDEAQDIARHQTPKEMQAVINTLKTLMEHRDWQVGLILSGMPSLRDMLNFDRQLSRRVAPIELRRLTPEEDSEEVVDLLSFYADIAGLQAPAAEAAQHIARRLIHAADREFGLAADMIVDGLTEALSSGASELNLSHFAAAFAARSGCIPAFNPFIADDYERLDVRTLLKREGEP